MRKAAAQSKPFLRLQDQLDVPDTLRFMSTLYRTGEFEIDPFVRELRHGKTPIEIPSSAFDCLVYLVEHRSRPVGRDELIAAVWGRADVSETLLGHSIVRLRRVLGDSGNDQHVIRTMPRVGYRWIAATVEVQVDREADLRSKDAEGEVALDTSAAIGDAVSPTISQDPAAVIRAVPRGLRYGAATLLLAVIAAVLMLSFGRPVSLIADMSVGRSIPTGMVFPATVKAPADWSWLRLGLMDLVGMRLQRGSISTLQSETVLGLLKNARGDTSALLSDTRFPSLASLRVVPAVEFSGQSWHVRLDAVEGRRRLQVDARHADALVAARTATDLLLVKLGHAPPVDEGRISPALDQLQQQVKAATLAGQFDLARALLREAPGALRESPELGWSSALIEATTGDYEKARRGLDGLLARVSAEQNPSLRARALTMRAAMYTRRGTFSLAGADYSEAIGLVESGHEPLVLAHAYMGRGLVAAASGDYDNAIADLGRARVISESADGALSIAQIDLNLGLIAKDRGQLGAALPILVQAADRFEKLASLEEWAVATEAIADVQKSNLDFDDALATTDKFWPPEQRVGNLRLQWSLTLTRASVLANTGRLDDAAVLARHVQAIASQPEDGAFKARANSVLAYVDRARGDPAKAALMARAALTPALESTDRATYRDSSLLYVGALQASDQLAASAQEGRVLRGWLLARPDDQAVAYAWLVEARQADAEGNTTAALQKYAEAWDAAGKVGVPELLVACAAPYANLLIRLGRLEDASGITGRIAPWGEQDLRVALTEMHLYEAMGRTAAWQKATGRAVRLAGQRVIPSRVR